MTILDAVLNNDIHVDFGEEILFGSDQMYDTYPKQFATVSMCLVGNDCLCEIADKIRMKDGHMPFFSETGEFGVDCDPYGYYNFYFGLNDLKDCRVDTAIEFTVASDFADDDCCSYLIDISEEEQKLLYECIDRQFKMELGKSVEDILAEARKEMEAQNV